MNEARGESRLLIVDPRSSRVESSRISRLPALLRAGDVLVVNDAATLPASMFGRAPGGSPIELRLVEAPLEDTCRVVLFGEGDHRVRTEDRPPPPRVNVGEELLVAGQALEVREVSSLSPRLVTLRFPRDPEVRYRLLYGAGRPVQYSHAAQPYALWDVQTVFAARPWAVEMPSAARPLRWATLLELLRRGVRIVRVTHGAGLSATGDPALDRALPLDERYDIPEDTVLVIERARREGQRVIAVGTSATRALEDCALRHGRLRAGEGRAELLLSGESEPRVVDGIMSGIHVEGESHHALLLAFAEPGLLARASREAERAGYARHEHGDACIVLAGALPEQEAALVA